MISQQLSLGVEEEFHVVDLETRQAAPLGPRVLEGLPDNFAAELQRSVVETNSSVVTTLDDLRRDLVSVRKQLAIAANRHGVGVVAAGTVPLVDHQDLGVTPSNARYAQMLADYQLLVREQVICGTQVHVGVPSRDRAVAVARRVSADLAGAAGAVGQLALLAGRGHRLRELPHLRLVTLADQWSVSRGA